MPTNRAVTLLRRPARRTPYSSMAASAARSNGQSPSSSLSFRSRPPYSLMTSSVITISSSNSARTLKIFRKSSSYS